MHRYLSSALAMLAIIGLLFGAYHVLTIPADDPQERVLLEEGAQRHGISVEDYKQKLIDEENAAQLLSKAVPVFRKALITNDLTQITKSLKTISTVDIKSVYPTIYTEIIAAENIDALDAALDAGIPCSVQSLTGRAAFESAANHQNYDFLQSLINKECDTQTPGLNRYGAADIIATSNFPERILLYPEGGRKPRAVEIAFSKVLETGNASEITQFIEADVNLNSKLREFKQTPLNTVLSRNFPELAVLMIEQGASINLTKAGAIKSFMLSFEKNYEPVYEAILVRNSVVLAKPYQRKALQKAVLSYPGRSVRREAVGYLLKNDTPLFSDWANKRDWLTKVVNQQDVKLATLLLIEDHYKLPKTNRAPKLRTAAKQLGNPNRSSFSKIILSDHDRDVLIQLLEQTGWNPQESVVAW